MKRIVFISTLIFSSLIPYFVLGQQLVASNSLPGRILEDTIGSRTKSVVVDTSSLQVRDTLTISNNVKGGVVQSNNSYTGIGISGGHNNRQSGAFLDVMGNNGTLLSSSCGPGGSQSFLMFNGRNAPTFIIGHIDSARYANHNIPNEWFDLQVDPKNKTIWLGDSMLTVTPFQAGSLSHSLEIRGQDNFNGADNGGDLILDGGSAYLHFSTNNGGNVNLIGGDAAIGNGGAYGNVNLGWNGAVARGLVNIGNKLTTFDPATGYMTKYYNAAPPAGTVAQGDGAEMIFTADPAVTSVTLSGSLIGSSNLLRGSSSFTATGTRRAVYIAGATSSDYYVCTPANNNGTYLPVAGDILMVYAKTDSLIVTRPASGTSGLAFNYMRMK